MNFFEAALRRASVYIMAANTKKTERSPESRVVTAFTVAALLLASGFLVGALAAGDPVVGALCVGAAFALVSGSLLLMGIARGLATFATREAVSRPDGPD